MPRWHETDVIKPLKFYVPSGTVEAPAGRGWTARHRGDTGGFVLTEYLCPEHGRFEVLQPRADVPDAAPCQCGAASPWSPSSVGIGVSSGEVTC